MECCKDVCYSRITIVFLSLFMPYLVFQIVYIKDFLETIETGWFRKSILFKGDV